jgi:hypothetical protein
MPNSAEDNQPNTPQQLTRPIARRESMEMLLASLDSGEGIANRLTEEHINTLLAQRGDIIEKIHIDRRSERWDGKFYFVGSLLFALIIIGGVAWVKPEFLSEVIIALVSGLGGYGYGYGKGAKKN